MITVRCHGCGYAFKVRVDKKIDGPDGEVVVWIASSEEACPICETKIGAEDGLENLHR